MAKEEQSVSDVGSKTKGVPGKQIAKGPALDTVEDAKAEGARIQWTPDFLPMLQGPGRHAFH